MADDTVDLAKQILSEKPAQRPKFSIAGKGFTPSQDQAGYQFQKLAPGQVNTMSLATIFDKAINRHLSLSPADRVVNSRNAVKALEPHLGVRKDGKPIALLSQNAKLLKATTGTDEREPIKIPDGRGVETIGLSLFPDYKEGDFKVCPNSASCRDVCLGKNAGQYSEAFTQAQNKVGKLSIRDRAMNRTKAMMREPEAFAVRLYDDIMSAKMEAERNGNHLGVRLNTLSDLNPRIHDAIIKNHPDVSFYDYTKMAWKPISDNHHYTYSSTGASQEGVDNPHTNWKKMRRHLDSGRNVAMVFTNKEKALPEYVHDKETDKKYKVIDGRWHDFRPLDELEREEGTDGNIVGLSNLKSTGVRDDAHKDSKGFFVRYDPKTMGNTAPIIQQKQQMTDMDNDSKVEPQQ